MSSWVVPSVAAELWRVPVEEVLGSVRSGAIATKKVGEFLFVDVAPRGTISGPPDTRPTFRILTEQELNALQAPLSPDPSLGGAPPDIAQWRRERQRVSGLRQAPSARTIS